MLENSVKALFESPVQITGNMINSDHPSVEVESNQQQTAEIFSEKWGEASKFENIEKLYSFQFEWFLKLYGFDSEDDLRQYLLSKNTIIDTGCGLGYKAAWFAKLAPHALVIGIDISDSVAIAAGNFKDIPNLFFLKEDIANTGIRGNCIDFTVCDQVIMHTQNPEETFKHLSKLTSDKGEFACYVYSKKALPREMIDDYFRSATHNISKEKMWEFSTQLTELGRNLSELNATFECPDMPMLGIKGGRYDVQRFIYWNFLKCFWKEDWGFDLSRTTNFDWYAPSNAKRFNKEEFLQMAESALMSPTYLHEEEACYSGRFSNKIIN